MFAHHQSPTRVSSHSQRWFYFILLLIIALSACERSQKTPTPPEGTFPVDPLFRAYYHGLGGEAVLGPAISPLFRKEDNFYQYFVGALLMYDSAADQGSPIRLIPLGREVGTFELPAGGVPQTGERYVDGYKLFEKFTRLYDQLGGEQVVGRPLTEARFNQDKQRYEQYFENVGFYWFDGDVDDAVHLLSYGTHVCGSPCIYEADINSAPESPGGSTPPAIKLAVAKLGLDFTGFPLGFPINTQGGFVEQLYENVKFVISPDNPDVVRLFPLPEAVGMVPEPPREPNPMPDMLFFPVGDNLGYNIPQIFVDYIRAHGDFDFIGEPISHSSRPDTGTIEQCFKNLCLEGSFSTEGEILVKPQPLGKEFEGKIISPPTPVGGLTDITLQVWERYSLISSSQEQEIGAVVMSGGKPYEDALVEITVGMPDGGEQIYRPAPTDENGETNLKLAPIQAKNGTLIPYKTCLLLPESQQFCVMDSFIIWQTDVIEITPTVLPDKTTYLPFVVRNFRMYVPALLESIPTYLPLIFKNP